MAIHRRLTARNALLALILMLLVCFVLNPNSALLRDRDRDRDQRVETYDDPTTLVAGEMTGEAAAEETGARAGAISSVNLVNGGKGREGATRRTAVVVASQKSEDAAWLDTYFPQWEKNIYRVDDPNAKLTVPKNKGRESMVYLT